MSDGITEAFRMWANSKENDIAAFEMHTRNCFIAAQRAFGKDWKFKIFKALRDADCPHNKTKEFKGD